MFYVYKIVNKINGKLYIGKTKKDEKKRWQDHLKIANGDKEKYPRLFFAIHAAIKKYGEENFSFEKEAIYDTEILAFIGESSFIEDYKSRGYILYNLTNGGEGPSGAKRSIETKIKMSLAHQKTGYTTGKQKLTIEDVIKIKKMLINNQIKMKDIAKLFSISFFTISNINREKAWSWVKVEGFKPAKRIPNRKLSTSNILDIKNMLRNKCKYRDIAKVFNVSVRCIQKIKNSETF